MYINRVDARAVLVLMGFVTALCLAQSRSAEEAAATTDGARARREGPRVHALFDQNSPDTAPFPSDQFTVSDRDQITGRRVNLPAPDCRTRPSDCEDVAVINTLDGFSVTPRVSIAWDGAIDVATVNSRTVFLIPLYNDHRSDRVIGIDQVVWNPERKLLFAKSAETLNQHSRYAIIVTNGIHDLNGKPVEASEAFGELRSAATSIAEVREAITAAREVGTPPGSVVAAAVFTTQSVTAALEKIRDQIMEAPPAAARFDLGPAGMRTVFQLSNVARAVWNQQTAENPQKFTAVRLDLSTLTPAVGTLAFGKYTSPDYEIHPGEFIPAIGTRTGRPSVQGMNDVYFDLFLPAGIQPATGWPVAIWGHGGDGDKTVNSLNVAGKLAAHGIATIAINAVGQGFGKFGTLTLTDMTGQTATLPSGGRGVDQNGDGVVDDGEGMSAGQPFRIIDDRDAFRQTVVDLLQLVRVIEAGVDVRGDGSMAVDKSRIYYVGQSMGAMYGALFLSVEPDVRVATLTALGGPRTTRRWNAVGARAAYGAMLASRTPSLVNSPGVVRLDGVAVAAAANFNENTPLPNEMPLSIGLEDGAAQVIRSPVIDTVPGAFDIQRFFENSEWVMQAANPVAYAQHLIKAPLPGVAPKALMMQFARGDQFVPNPATSAFLRAGSLEGLATLYRHDLASIDNPALPKPAHGFMVSTARFGAISLGAQEQIAVFLASDGAVLIHPDPQKYFEVPVIPPLPDDLGFVH